MVGIRSTSRLSAYPNNSSTRTGWVKAAIRLRGSRTMCSSSLRAIARARLKFIWSHSSSNRPLLLFDQPDEHVFHGRRNRIQPLNLDSRGAERGLDFLGRRRLIVHVDVQPASEHRDVHDSL